MKQNYIITGTVTYAIKGRDILLRKGYSAEIKRTSGSGSNVGCGYGILTDCDAETVRELFKKYGIKILQIV